MQGIYKILLECLRKLYIRYEERGVTDWQQKQGHFENGTAFLYDGESDLAMPVDCCF